MTPRLARRAPGAHQDALAAAGIDRVLARIYAARGVCAPGELDTSFAALPHPSLLMGAAAAAERLATAIAHDERIVIVADYDADGATACALGVRALRGMGARVDFIVPNRFVHGYGLTPEIVALAAAGDPALIVTVDNGIASVDGVRAAAQRGIDVLITDHHLPGAVLPSPAIIVNPNQPGCTFPSRNLAGVGVMFYVLLATRARLRDDARAAGREVALPNLAALLDLVALGTVADVVPLDAINRALVAQGLARIRKGAAQPGIAALFAAANRATARASAYDLGFVAGPRINAAGRLDDMTVGIRCLLADDAHEAGALAARLSALNTERRAIEATMRDAAMAAIASLDASAFAAAHSICLVDAAWHQGVVGIVAARLKETYHRPAIVFAPGDDGELKGSGRSIAGFHLRDALERVASASPGLLRRFGGHAMAAGLTLDAADFAAFATAFEAVAREWLTPAQLTRTLETDGALDAGELTLTLARAIESGVWGQGFPPPRFEGAFDVVAQRVVGGSHSKLRLAGADGEVDAMLFGHAEPLPSRIHAAFRPQVDRYQGVEALTIIIEHWADAVDPPGSR
ncbi:MAG TPA: single-stranded-DNA-specific exonuclease RecJ [Casimicrobiaceae bacterium]|nr:single-stranded-DNA-specific exonuclease RecJ [Casimicrobiaceae bacterium]